MEARDTDVIILCGGRGTRLGALTDDIPKPLVEIHGKSFLEILIDAAAQHGFTRFILATGYKGEKIEEVFRNGKKHRILFSREPEPLGTGGGLLFSARQIQSENFLVMNGDSLCAADLGSLLAFHGERTGLATVTVTPAEESRTDGGYLSIGANHKILSFEEKKFAPGRFINAGIYVLNRKILARIPQGKTCSLEKEIFPALRPEEIHAFVTNQKLFDIGTPERLETFRNSYNARS